MNVKYVNMRYILNQELYDLFNNLKNNIKRTLNDFYNLIKRMETEDEFSNQRNYHLDDQVFIEAATIDNEIIGFIVYSMKNERNKAKIELLVVSQPYRRIRIATTLLKHALRHIGDCGFSSCEIKCLKENVSACEFYIVNGGKPVRKEYYDGFITKEITVFSYDELDKTQNDKQIVKLPINNRY